MNQRRTIMGACDYSIATMQTLKKDLMDVGAKHQDTNWAIGGIVCALTSNLLQICNKVFVEDLQSEQPNAAGALTEIKTRFDEVVETMLGQNS